MYYYWPDANYESDDLCNGIELKMAASRLSKSRIMSSLQCLKRVHLEINRKDLVHFSKATEAAFALGHEVGDIAIELYGGDQGTFIEYNGGNFTATLQHGGVLVREDVLLPVDDENGKNWRIVEIKASTKVKPEHIHDCAVQAWVHTGAGYALSSIILIV